MDIKIRNGVFYVTYIEGTDEKRDIIYPSQIAKWLKDKPDSVKELIKLSKAEVEL